MTEEESNQAEDEHSMEKDVEENKELYEALAASEERDND